MVKETLWPDRGLSGALLTSKGINESFPSSSYQSNVVPVLEKHVRNDKYPNFEWTGEEGGMLIVLFSETSHLKTLPQQFCHWL